MKALAIHDLTYRYEDGTCALNRISFTLNEGERVGLIGANGAGKSTLLLHLNGLLPDKALEQSSIAVFDQPVIEKNFSIIRAQIGLLFQDPDDQLFCPTVEEDVAFGPRQFGIPEKQVSEIVHSALKDVGMLEAARRSPHRLSRGEKRRICLAGVLACHAKLLALDEPTSDLDPRSRRELLDILLHLPITQIVASHDLDFIVQLCPRIIVLDHGSIVADGDTHELLDDESLMLKHGLERPHILRHLHPH